MDDERIVISSGLVITPEAVATRTFTTVLRGCQPGEVRQFLRRVADEMALMAGREAELRRALQEALARAAHPELDEAALTTGLGEHAGRLIASAREQAAAISADAEKSSTAMLRDAEARVARMRQEADSLMARRVEEVDGVTANRRQSAEAEVRSIRDQARAEAEAVLQSARAHGKEMVAEAREVRERMLGDLARRRRAGQVQIEQLRVARERLVAAYEVVRRTLDEATAELAASEPEARLAAEAVARRMAGSDLPLPPAGPDSHAAAGAAASPRLSAAAAPPPNAPPTVAAAAPASASPAAPAGPSSIGDPAMAGPRLRPQSVADSSHFRVVALPRVSSPAGEARIAEVARGPRARPPELQPELATGETTVVPERGRQPVDELFARIRANRGPRGVAELPSSVAGEARLGVADAAALSQRDRALDPLDGELARVLKRVLQDEQNEVLDRLRRAQDRPGPEPARTHAGVLPHPADQAARFRELARPILARAAAAGGGVEDGESERLAAQLSDDLGRPLRERLERAVGEPDDPGDQSEAVRAAYRQCRLQEIEPVVRHHLAAAYAGGAFSGAPRGAPLRWVVDDDGPCSDCADNALAGPTPKGDAYPTGQACPPAHRGCRCLLVPAAT